MSWWNDLRVFLAGKKTILTAILYGIDATGSSLGWWQADEMRTIAEEVVGVVFLRQGIASAIKTALAAPPPAGQTVTVEVVK